MFCNRGTLLNLRGYPFSIRSVNLGGFDDCDLRFSGYCKAVLIAFKFYLFTKPGCKISFAFVKRFNNCTILVYV